MRSITAWEREFYSLIFLSMIAAGILYSIQFYVFDGMNFDQYGISGNFIRCIRMIMIYVVPVIWFKKRRNESFRDLGILPSRQYPILSTIGGILVYSIAAIVFISNEIGTRGWGRLPIVVVIINQVLIGIMASVTDFWTRGFVLFELDKKYNHKIAIAGQNIVWFMLHLYEIAFLAPYIRWIGAILLTLTLGISGDLIALKTKSITGLMLGHILLNVAIATSGRIDLF